MKNKRKITKEIWMTAADIPQNTIIMMSEPLHYFIYGWPKQGLGAKLKKHITHFINDFSQMHYPRKEFDRQADFLANKMLKDPVWALKVIRNVEEWSKKYFEKSRIIWNSNLKKMTDHQIARLYQSCLKYHRMSHGVGASVSWHADAEKERVTKGIWKEIENQKVMVGCQRDMADIFSILSTPKQESYIVQEEKDFLRLGSIFFKDKKIREIFKKNKLEKLDQIFKEKAKPAYRQMKIHHNKYCWLDYQYKGPAAPMISYLGRWQELLISGHDPKGIFEHKIFEKKSILHEQKALIKELKFNKYQRDLVMLAQRMVFIKEFRKEALYHGMYCYEPMFKEIANRNGLSLSQIWLLTTWELNDLILKHKINIDEINERQKRAVFYIDRQTHKIYGGDEADRFFKKIKFEKISFKNIKELKGTPACPGTVRGTVKIINVPNEMGKMKTGDIMVAHNTNPNLVPAMKKAAALVSEAGGLTCHTAIVAREIRVPCIVGVPGADKILKDGDKVEVQASIGKIIILKKNN